MNLEKLKELERKIAEKVYPTDPSPIDNGIEGAILWVRKELCEIIPKEKVGEISTEVIKEAYLRNLHNETDEYHAVLATVKEFCNSAE